MYSITSYSYNRAKELGVNLKPSKYKNKKIDVYDYHNNFIVSIGDSRFKDYPTYLKERGKTYADGRRRLYKMRHEKDRKVLGSTGYYSDQILW